MLRKFIYECRRVLRVARKPGRAEYLDISKITGLGILLVGLVGFLIMMISYAVGGMAGVV
ncbi:MAG: protein translocase SEC61 complex subunit gamma [Candidatus Hadarchaeales archaeon]